MLRGHAPMAPPGSALVRHRPSQDIAREADLRRRLKTVNDARRQTVPYARSRDRKLSILLR